MNLDMKQPVSFLVWTVAILCFALVARIGWEVGGKLWGIFLSC